MTPEEVDHVAVGLASEAVETLAFRIDGERRPVIVVEVPAAPTVCVTPADVLATKSASPA